MSSGKEAVVFILDSSPTMDCLYPSLAQAAGCDGSFVTDDEPHPHAKPSASTRLSCAKAALEGMLCDLMLQSKTNEAGVVVLKTRETRHHLCAEEQVADGTAPFPNLTELSEVARPTVDLLRRVRRVQSVKMEDDVDWATLRGDVCDGIVLASDALYRRTNGKKYRRRLVLFTDAAHEVKVDTEQILMVVESLRKLECTLTVIGLDFSNSAEFEKPAEEGASQAETETEGYEEDDGVGSDGESESSCETEEGTDDEEGRLEHVKNENEKLLISLARLTGGSVIAASTMQEIIESTSGRRIPKSSRRKFELHIAPGLSLEARFSLLLSKANLPSLKREAVTLDDKGEVMRNALGEEMMSKVMRNTTHWDADNAEIEVGLDKRTQAFKYGADLIPIGGFDLEGLKIRSPVSISILGYADVTCIPRSLMMGPPYAVSGGDSRRACTAVSALAQGMHKLKLVAVCSMVKSKDTDPLMGALFPLIESRPNVPHRLYYVKLPFAEDVQKMSMLPFDDVGNDTDGKVCDDLIDSLLLSDDILRTEKIANPAIRSFNKTLMNRAIDPSSPIVPARSEADTGEDPMATPMPVMTKATKCIKCFRDAFPLAKESEDDSQGGSRARRKFWNDAD